MCAIIDNNITADIVNDVEYVKPVIDYLKAGGRIATSQSIIKEYPNKFLSLLDQLKKNNQVTFYHEVNLTPIQTASMKSDDPHILALVMNSDVRVVCTRDVNLIKDLKNPNFVAAPRCKVYARSKSKSVLNGCCT